MSALFIIPKFTASGSIEPQYLLRFTRILTEQSAKLIFSLRPRWTIFDRSGRLPTPAADIPRDLHYPNFHVKLKASQNTNTAFPKRAST